MTSIVNLWRTRDERYRLQGTVCSDCGQVSFPPRARCLTCPPPSAFVYDDEITLEKRSDEIPVDHLLGVCIEPATDHRLSAFLATLAAAPMAECAALSQVQDLAAKAPMRPDRHALALACAGALGQPLMHDARQATNEEMNADDYTSR